MNSTKTSQIGSSDAIATLILGAIVIGMIVAAMLAWPHYKIWSQEMRGKAALTEARQTKMIQVEQARAERDSAELRAEAIAIMGATAKQFPEYRAQEFIGAFGEALREGNIEQIIYIPTEGAIPIMEAGARVQGALDKAE